MHVAMHQSVVLLINQLFIGLEKVTGTAAALGRSYAEFTDLVGLIYPYLDDARISDDCAKIALDSGDDDFYAIILKVRHIQAVKPDGAPHQLPHGRSQARPYDDLFV
jgi:hypothetical protein